MGADVRDAAALHNENAVGVLDGGHALRDDDLRGLRDEIAEALTDQGVGLRVDRGGGVVEDQHLRLLQHRAGDAETLLLTTGDVGTALGDEGVVLVREGLNELVRLGELTGRDELLVGRLRVTPAEVLRDGAGEENILLKHDSHLVTQELEVVLPYVDAADADLALACVVETGNQLDERGLRGAGTAHDADGFTRLDVKIDVREDVILSIGLILEAHVVEIDRAILHLGHRGSRICEGARLVQDLGDTLGRLGRHGHHDENHAEHHEGHEDLEAVGQERGELSDIEVDAAARDDRVGAEAHDENHDGVEAELHQRVVEREDALGLREVALDVGRRAVELLHLVVLTHEGLHDAHAVDVLLDGVVQAVVLLEDATEDRHDRTDDDGETDAEDRDDRDEDPGHASAHDEGGGEGENQHRRRTEAESNQHHVGLLQVLDVRGHTGDEGARLEMVDVFEGKVLNLIEKVFSEITRETGGCGRTAVAGRDTAQQRQGRQHDQHDAVLSDGAQSGLGLDLVNQHRRHKRDDGFDQ